MPGTYVMKVSANGQVSIPAETRARWMADRVVVVDLGDRVVLRPLPADPVADFAASTGVAARARRVARQAARSADAARDRQRR